MINFLFGAVTTCDNKFFFLPNWWEFLKQPSPPNCNIAFNFPGDIWAVGLAILDMLLRIGGFVAVISIIIAGIQYIVSSGSPENVTSARKRIINSFIGLAIVLIASAVVAFIGKTFGG
ncbi:pilin [Candidatus Saccharibacteria bacterium]|nr:pilin [Candidatus Saccharibacteria bacterium]